DPEDSPDDDDDEDDYGVGNGSLRSPLPALNPPRMADNRPIPHEGRDEVFSS
ncbi:hypothetical protein IFR05_011945, partial [Cadophora sp. M221]